jgi:hypothetical protein
MLMLCINRKGGRWATSVTPLKPFTVSDVPAICADTFNLGIFGIKPEGSYERPPRRQLLFYRACFNLPF